MNTGRFLFEEKLLFVNQLYKEKEMKGCIKSAQWEIEPSAPAASLPCSTRPHLSSTRFKSCEQIAATPSLLHITFHRLTIKYGSDSQTHGLYLFATRPKTHSYINIIQIKHDCLRSAIITAPANVVNYFKSHGWLSNFTDSAATLPHIISQISWWKTSQLINIKYIYQRYRKHSVTVCVSGIRPADVRNELGCAD